MKLASRRASGIIRATIKLGTVKPASLERLQDYRAAVAERAVLLLAPRAGDRSSAVRVAMQVIFATTIDAILQGGTMPLKANGKRMVDVLTGVLDGCLNSSRTGQWLAPESDDDVSIEIESEEAPDVPLGRMAVYDPSDRVYRGTAPSFHKPNKVRDSAVKSGKSTEAPGPSRTFIQTRATVKPPSVPPTPKPQTELPKRKRRLI
jgi:hypothetical protein